MLCLDHEEVVDMRRLRRDLLETEVADPRQPGGIRLGMPCSRLIPGWQVPQLDAQKSRLQPVESRVHPLDDVVVLRPLAVVTQSTCSLDDSRVARRDHAAVAVRAEILAWIEAEACE